MALINEDDNEIIGLTLEETDKIQNFMNEFFQGKLFDDTKSSKLMDILYQFKKPFKYIADCMITQKVGAGMTNYTSALYDKNSDNIYHFYYPHQAKEKSFILVLITVFVISYSSKNWLQLKIQMHHPERKIKFELI